MGGASAAIEVDAEGMGAVGQFQRRFGATAQDEGIAPPATFTGHQQRWCGVGLFRLPAAHVHQDIGAAECVKELQATIVDTQALELRRGAALAVAEEVPVARVTFARRRLQQYVRAGQADFGKLHVAAQQWPHAHVDLDPVGAGHVRLFRPGRIGEGEGIGAHGGGAAEVDIQVADVQGAPGTGLHRTFHRALEPVPVPQGNEDQDCREQEYQHGEPALPTWTGATQAPARRLGSSRSRGSIHAAMVAPSGWTGREAIMCMVCRVHACLPGRAWRYR
ncbi:hypothetical protein D3C81_310740 [compost metagenome]